MTATGDRASSGDAAESPQLALPLSDAPHVAILTGLSGGGKTAAAKLFAQAGAVGSGPAMLT